MSFNRAFFLAVLALGCGTRTPMGVDFVDGGPPAGPRLQPWQLSPEGASPVLVGITDTVEGQRCTFLTDSEGELRCLPPSPASLWSAGEFADAACTKPLYRVSLADAAAFAGLPLPLPLPRNYCEPQRHVVGILREVPDATPRYQQDFVGACVETPPSRSPGEIGIVAGDVVAPTRYVAGTLVDGALVGGRVREREITTADGARFVDHLVDERWGKRCTLSAGEGDAVTCAVEELYESSFFTDAACEQGGLARADSCADPAYMRAGGAAFTLGVPWQAEVYARIKACRLERGAVRGAPATAPIFYQRGEPLDGDVVARAAWRTEGTARLATRGLRADDGRLVALSDAVRGATTPAFRDNLTGEDCRAIETPSGDVRCVPPRVRDGQTPGHLFADAACTTPAYLCSPGDCAGFEFVPDATSPAPRLAVAVAVATAYTDFDGSCAASDAFSLFTAGADVPWDKYPLVPVTGAPPR
jgi:hypothetical protein